MHVFNCVESSYIPKKDGVKRTLGWQQSVKHKLKCEHWPRMICKAVYGVSSLFT